MATIAPPKRSQKRNAEQDPGAEYRELATQRDALVRKRDVLQSTLDREGKLTREQRSEFAKVGREIKALATPLKRAWTRFERAEQKLKRAQERERERERRIEQREEQKRRAKATRRATTLTAQSYRKARFVRLPKKAKPSKATSSAESRPVYSHGYVTKEGRGEKARWVLVVTDAYELVILPLEVSDPSAIKAGTFIPAEALKAIEKTGAFRVTKQGAIQPLMVQETFGGSVPYDGGTDSGYGYAPGASWQRYVATDAGTAYVAASPGKFPDYRKTMPKPPAKTNSFEVVIDPTLLVRTAEALGNKTRLRLHFDLSKAGKASQGRKCSGAILVSQNGAGGVVMPIRPDSSDEVA